MNSVDGIRKPLLLHLHIGNQAKVVAQHLLQRVHALNPRRVTLLLPKSTLQLLQTGLRSAQTIIHTEDHRSIIYAHICSCTQQSWCMLVQYNRLGSIWHRRLKPNVAKSYSTYRPLSTCSKSKLRCHRSSRHSSNTRAVGL